ncbi:PSD1 and planctomycete cytochrome C domain-containing protein [Tautonia rosea]|uniref:PSD1 and planctomycete cytochrome C domain-containing protein n=1 Tax=Tautonia rosea TaxID=2728037 RepID=UPI0014730843|nr:PSD1 and planctomycete cytochrome C domain-containing protein [Tautonia rosea]
MPRLCLIGLVGFLAFSSGTNPTFGASEDGPPIVFNRDIRPILAENCLFCHGPDPTDRRGNLRLDQLEDARADRGGYRVIDQDDPEASELLFRITSEDDLDRMPPPDSGKELTDEQIEMLRRWIAEGAEDQPHWSFVPLTRPPLPEVHETSWPINPIDQFLLSRIETEGHSPAPEADPVTLARRVALDLTGLPPQSEDVNQLLEHDRAGEYERFVDRLLASPRYGERMAILWLDLVRYADTVGYHGDQEHHATPYRDYVVAAFNQNMPFDRFTHEQLAGDLLPNASIDQRVASGYNRLLQTTHEGGAQDGEYLAKYAADRVRNVSAVWLGATMGCAECHDHKYDPYTQRDFYRIAAFFADLEQRGAYPGPDATPTIRAPEIEVLDPIDRQALLEVEQAIEALTIAGNNANKQDLEQLEQRREAIRKRSRRTMVSVSVEPRITRVLARGDWMDTTGEVVDPGVPEVLPELKTSASRASRLDLAQWLTRPDHPLTARVFVNRLWNHFFGRGLSRSLDDTGLQGELPSHPELLDWLAVEFIESGWDIKHLIRLIVTSKAFRQSSIPDPAMLKADPGNDLFARQQRFRLPAEVIRDQALAISGLLVEQRGGSSARPYQPEGYYAHLNFPKRQYQADTDLSQYRRGLYVHWQRQFLHPMLRAFDAPTREECTTRRPSSNTPIGALTLLNDPSFVEAARVLATRVLLEHDGSDRDRMVSAWRSTLTRDPSDAELEALQRLLEASRIRYESDPTAASAVCSTGLAQVPEALDRVEVAAWTAICRALLNLHETITRF